MQAMKAYCAIGIMVPPSFMTAPDMPMLLLLVRPTIRRIQDVVGIQPYILEQTLT